MGGEVAALVARTRQKCSRTIKAPMDREAIIETLNDLIENCKDGEYGFHTCAEYVRSDALRSLLQQRAAGCRQAAQDLVVLVMRLDGTPDDGGSASGAVHRGWLNVRGTIALDDDLAMLAECERGEDIAVARYRAALDKDLPLEFEQVVRRQYEGALRNHDEIKTLRDSLAKTPRESLATNDH
jgi:uncharacterized protein (TIGR02284 family)